MFWCPLLIMPHLSLGTHLIKMCIIQSPNKLTFIFAIWTTKLVIPLVLCSQTLLNKTITIKRTVKNILKQKLALFWTFSFVIHFFKVRTSKTPSNKRIFNEWLFLCLCLRKRKPAKAEELSSFYLSLKCVFPTYIFINKIFCILQYYFSLLCFLLIRFLNTSLILYCSFESVSLTFLPLILFHFTVQSLVWHKRL